MVLFAQQRREPGLARRRVSVEHVDDKYDLKFG
jgi:hypothetical protein